MLFLGIIVAGPSFGNINNRAASAVFPTGQLICPYKALRHMHTHTCTHTHPHTPTRTRDRHTHTTTPPPHPHTHTPQHTHTHTHTHTYVVSCGLVLGDGLDDVGHEAQHGPEPQQEGEPAEQITAELHPLGRGRGRGQGVGPVTQQELRRLGIGQPLSAEGGAKCKRV